MCRQQHKRVQGFGVQQEGQCAPRTGALLPSCFENFFFEVRAELDQGRRSSIFEGRRIFEVRPVHQGSGPRFPRHTRYLRRASPPTRSGWGWKNAREFEADLPREPRGNLPLLGGQAGRFPSPSCAAGACAFNSA